MSIKSTVRYGLAIALVTVVGSAAAIEVGSIDNSRFINEWTLNGDEMDIARSKLLDPANFGPEGTVSESINITDIATPITLETLRTFDVFFIGYLQDADDDAFTSAELQAFQDYVNGGGSMIITCDAPTYDAVCAAFGPTPSSSDAAPPVVPSGAGTTDPLFDGPFGTASELGMSGFQRFFSATSGFSVIGQDQNDQPVVLRASIGEGEVIFFTDVDLISDETLSPETGINNDNDIFLGNLFADLGLRGGVSPSPAPAVAVSTLSPLGLLILAMALAVMGAILTRR